MNELQDLGPDTAHLNQKPENPYRPGDRAVKSGDDDASVAVVVEVLPPEQNVELYGQEIDGEAVSVASPSSLDNEPSDWWTIHPAKLASYCDDQDIQLYSYKHENLEPADPPFSSGDYVIKPDYSDPDLAVVTAVDGNEVSVVFQHLLEDALDDSYVYPKTLNDKCEEADLTEHSFSAEDLVFEPQY